MSDNIDDWEGLNKYLTSILEANIDENCEFETKEDRQSFLSLMERELVYGNDISTAHTMGVPRSKVEEYIKDKDHIDSFYD